MVNDFKDIHKETFANVTAGDELKSRILTGTAGRKNKKRLIAVAAAVVLVIGISIAFSTKSKNDTE